MGHEDLSTAQQYIGVTGWDLERAIARLEAWREVEDSATPELKRKSSPRSRAQHRSADPGQNPA
jgi:hypothetical protein